MVRGWEGRREVVCVFGRERMLLFVSGGEGNDGGGGGE